MTSQIPTRAESLVIITNSGCLRGFRLREEWPGSPIHLQEIDTTESPQRPGPLKDEVSDQAGRFPTGSRSGIPGGMSHGEAHGKLEEAGRRRLRKLAGMIEALASERDDLPWTLAAPPEINARLVGLLSEPVRRRLGVNLQADLTKLPLADLEKRLLNDPKA